MQEDVGVQDVGNASITGERGVGLEYSAHY